MKTKVMCEVLNSSLKEKSDLAVQLQNQVDVLKRSMTKQVGFMKKIVTNNVQDDLVELVDSQSFDENAGDDDDDDDVHGPQEKGEEHDKQGFQ